MWLFSRKKEQKDVSETFESRLRKVEGQILDLYTDYDLLRNKVLRKIQVRPLKNEEVTVPKRGGIVSDSQIKEMLENGNL